MPDTGLPSVITGTDLEIAAVVWTDRIRRDVDSLADRIRTVCPEGSLIRTADELRSMAHSLSLLTDHVLERAQSLEATHAG